VAGDRAFDWQTSFPEVFADGGFDVVVGNPPYVRSRGLFTDQEKSYYLSEFNTASHQLDLYKLFIEKSLNLMNDEGYTSFITPSAFLVNDNDRNLREYLLNRHRILNLAFPSKKVFSDAEVKTVIFNIKKHSNNNDIVFTNISNEIFQDTKSISRDTFKGPNFIINENTSNGSGLIITKISLHPILEQLHEVSSGIKVRKELLYSAQIDQSYKPFILGKDVLRYSIEKHQMYIHYTSDNEKLYSNQRFRTSDTFEQHKIVVRQIPGKKHLFASFDDNRVYADQTTYLISRTDNNSDSLKYLLTLLSSKLLKFYFDNVHSDNKETFPKVKRSQLLEFPIPDVTQVEQQPFVTLADQLLTGHRELHAADAQFATLLRAELGLTASLTGRLALNQEWKTWSTALHKALGRTLTLAEKGEWLPYYTQHQEQQAHRRQHLAQLDRQLDQLVYQLYHLTPAEIALVEGT